MRSYRIYQVDAFTKTKLSGNPAGVVPNADGLTDEEMQRIARELNNSETAFIFSPTDRSHDVWVRFFTPLREVPICGHATIAAHYVRAAELSLPDCRVLQRTGAGILPVEIQKVGSDTRVIMTQGAITFGGMLRGDVLSQLLNALGLTPDDLRADCPVCIISTGHSKVMVGIRSLDRLHALCPDMTHLVRISEASGCNGFYVFTLHPDEPVRVHGRMFAPAIGIVEDPVTGNANGPLGAYLVRYGLLPKDGGEVCFTAMQGEAIRRPGSMEVRVLVQGGEPQTVRIVGEAVIAFSGVLTLESPMAEPPAAVG